MEKYLKIHGNAQGYTKQMAQFKLLGIGVAVLVFISSKVIESTPYQDLYLHERELLALLRPSAFDKVSDSCYSVALFLLLHITSRKFHKVGRRSGQKGILFCPFCKASKPPHFHHCSSCNVCVEQMDHHCKSPLYL